MGKGCEKSWSRKHLNERLSCAFIDGPLKKHREKILYDRVKALLPQTQNIVLQRKREAEYQEKLNAIFSQIKELKKARIALDIEYGKTTANNKSENVVVNKFIQKCSKENCRGFINEDWVCGLCEGVTCKKCCCFLEDDTHVCSEADIATATLLKKETKPCPKCATLIYKIDGCDQMWCTQCKTAFDWKTGELYLKNIHNPHFYEWLRSQVPPNQEIPRHPGDVPDPLAPCQELSYHFTLALESRMQKLGIHEVFVSSQVHYWIQSVMHVRGDIRKFNVNWENDSLEIRVDFLMGNKDDKTMERDLQRKEKQNEWKQEIFEVLQMYCNVVRDFLVSYFHQLDNLTKNKTELFHALERIREYTNACLLEIASTYKVLPFALVDMHSFANDHGWRSPLVRLSKTV